VALGMLVALDDLPFGNLFEALFGLDALEVFDRLSGWLVDHPEGDGAFGRGGRKHPDGDEYEGEAKIAGPDGDGGHGDTRERYRLPESGAWGAHRK
jgi:hypothetical protein